MAQAWFPAWSVLSVIFLCAFCGVEGHEHSHERRTPVRTSPPRENSTPIKCSMPKSKFIVTLAEYSPASETFCEPSTCASNGSITCRLGKAGESQVCNQKFGSADVWRLYQGCGSYVDKGMSCGDVASLSQRRRYEVKYDCLEETSRRDPCHQGTTGRTRHIYHDLSSTRTPRQCTCTGDVLGLAQVREKDVKVHVSFLVMLHPRQHSPHHHHAVTATIETKNGMNEMEPGTFPDFLFVNVSRQTPSISVSLRVPERQAVSGFVWLHFQDVTVNLTCTSSGAVTDMSGPRERTTARVNTTLASTPSPGDNWIITGVLVGAAGVAVIITALAICILLRRRRSRRSRRQPPETQPVSPSNQGQPSPSPSPHDAYTEVSPNHLQTPSHHHLHHHASPSNDREPARHNTGNDVGDYATLQHHVGQRAAPPRRGSNNTYDHALRLGEEYQALDRGVRRQQVIDHDYDSGDRLLLSL